MKVTREALNWKKGMRLSIEDMHTTAQARGGLCLSTEYRNTSIKLRWKCGDGHIWEATAASLRNSRSWCPVCAFEKLRLKIGDMRAVARERGGECLSDCYVNNETKLRWRCADGHEWEAKPMHIRLGRWCPACSRKWHLITMEQIHALAQARGGVCLSTHYANDGQKLRWRCAKGHEWLAIPSKIKSGSWCSKCSRPSYTISDMQVLADSRGGNAFRRNMLILKPGCDGAAAKDMNGQRCRSWCSGATGVPNVPGTRDAKLTPHGASTKLSGYRTDRPVRQRQLKKGKVMDRAAGSVTMSAELIGQLQATPWRYGFFELMRRINANLAKDPVGAAILPRRETFRIGQKPGLICISLDQT